jgi:hypothetical protein
LTIGTASSRHYLRVQIMHELVLWFSQVWETQLFTIWHFKAIPSATRRFPPMPECPQSMLYQQAISNYLREGNSARTCCTRKSRWWRSEPRRGRRRPDMDMDMETDMQRYQSIRGYALRAVFRLPSSVPLLLHIRPEREIVSSLSGSPSAAALGNAGSRSIGAVGVALWGVIVW